MSESSVNRTSMASIIASAATNVSSVLAEYMTDGPTIMRTALRSLVARDIRSPVRLRLVVRQRQRLQVREEVVAHVVLDVARRADQDPPRPEAEDAADQADGQQFPGVEQQLAARHPGRQVVDRHSQHQRRRERDGGGGDGTDEPKRKGPPIAPDVAEKPAEGGHRSSIEQRARPSSERRWRQWSVQSKWAEGCPSALMSTWADLEVGRCCS